MQVALEWQLLPRPQKSVPVKNNKKDSCTHFVYDIKHMSSAYNCSKLLQLQRHQINLYCEKGSSADSRCTIYLIFPPIMQSSAYSIFFSFSIFEEWYTFKVQPMENISKICSNQSTEEGQVVCRNNFSCVLYPWFP